MAVAVVAALGGALLGVAVLVVLLLATYRRLLRPRLVAELVRLSGPSIVHALPPRDVMILHRIDEGFCYWQPPYPCYVESIHFEAADFSVDESRSWLFRVVPFALQSRIVTGDWTRAEALKDLCVRSWLLPGHGVALLWKPSSDDQGPFGDTLES